MTYFQYPRKSRPFPLIKYRELLLEYLQSGNNPNVNEHITG